MYSTNQGYSVLLVFMHQYWPTYSYVHDLRDSPTSIIYEQLLFYIRNGFDSELQSRKC